MIDPRPTGYHDAVDCPVREDRTGPYDPKPRYLHGPCGLRTTDIRAFLFDMLSLDESAALGAKADTGGHWDDASPVPTDVSLYSASGKLTVGQHRHIARQDPARVLAEVDAKRRIIAEHAPEFGDCRVCAGPEESSDDAEGNRDWSRSALLSPCPTLRLLALPHRDHPEYQAAWASEA